MENQNQNKLMIVAAWINPNATKWPVSLMFSQENETKSLIGFKLGQTPRVTVVESFSKEVATSMGIDVNSLGETYDNATPLDIDFNAVTGLNTRIQTVELTESQVENHSQKLSFRPKTAGPTGPQLVTPDGEAIFHARFLVDNVKGNEDVRIANVPVKQMEIKPATQSAGEKVPF